MRTLSRFLGRAAAVSALVATMAVASIAATPSTPSNAQESPILGAGGEYHPLTPARVLDTRTGTGGTAGAKSLVPGAGATFDVALLGQGGLPATTSPSSVLAVVATVTVVDPTQQGYLRAWGSGNPEGESSIVNFSAGSNVPNLAVMVPGANGRLSVRLVSEGGSGTAHVLIDVVGWFSTSTYPTSGARLIPAGPGRIFDSRQAAFGAQPFGPGQTRPIQIRGANAVSPSITGIVPNQGDVSGVLVNITGVNNVAGSTTTFVSALPTAPAGPPSTSNLNLTSGQVKANLALVPVGADGAIHLYNSAGSTHLVVDVVAYMQPRPAATRVGRVIPLVTPFRVIDTRVNSPGAPAGQLEPGKGEDWNLSDFVADVKIGAVTVGTQSALLGNLTGTGLTRPAGWTTPVDTFLTVYPTPAVPTAPPPEISNLNMVESQNVPNMALFPYTRTTDATGNQVLSFRVYNYNGNVHYIVDASAVILAD